MEAVLSSPGNPVSRLAASGLSCRRGERLLFSGLSFAIEGGRCLMVTGPNGAGKTSLLRILAGLLRPEAGIVSYDAESEAEGRELCHFVGTREALKPTLTVREHVLFWRDLLGGDADPVAVADEWQLGLQLDLPAGYLSSGQRRRLALSRLTAAPRPIWLLDEPANTLDSRAHVTLVDRIEAHLAAGGIAVIATHLPIAVGDSDQIAIGGAA